MAKPWREIRHKADDTDAKRALRQLRSGREVILVLADGEEVAGTFEGYDGTAVRLVGADPIAADRIADVLIVVATQPPE